jgi:hypothetical protein
MAFTPTALTDSAKPRSTQPDPRPRARFPRAYVLLLGAVLIVLVLIALAPWEWSFIDDGNMLTILHGQQKAYGTLPGIPGDAYDWFRRDLTWGLFRPAFWVYAGTFYLLPVGPAHALRFAMLFAAVGGPMVAIARGFAGRARTAMVAWTGAAMLSNAGLYTGIWYPSLQELSGLAFVGLGLSSKRTWPRLVCWLIAAWFKSPFAWLLLAYGLLLFRRRETRLPGAIAAALAAGTVLAASVMARGGQYTSAVSYSLSNVERNLGTACGTLGGALIVVVAGLLVLRPRLELDAEPTATALLVGGAGYVVNLLVWKTDGYYSSPYVYLITAGLMLSVREFGVLDRRRLLAGLLTPVLVTGYFLAAAVHTGRSNIGTVIGLRDCVLNLPEGSVIGYNRQEAWIRLDYIVREHRPQWTGQVVMVEPNETTGFGRSGPGTHLNYVIDQPGYYAIAPALVEGPVVCRTPSANVYKVVP